MSILLLIDGPMGAGKSTVSNILSQKYGFKHLNIDDLKTHFKQWPAGYLYKEHLPIINEFAKNIVKSNLPIVDIIVDKSLGKNTSAEFVKIAQYMGIKVLKIMLWVEKDISMQRACKRQESSGKKVDQDYIDMVNGSWNKAFEYKNSDKSLYVIDNTDISPAETVNKVMGKVATL